MVRIIFKQLQLETKKKQKTTAQHDFSDGTYL